MSLRILIAEDEQITLKHLVQTLEQEGHRVCGVRDGMAAWERIRKDPFDLVITDIKMPKLDGVSLLEKIKETWPRTEVIVVTGFGSIDSAVISIKKGAYDYITKPFNLDEIVLKVRRIHEKKRLEKENQALKLSLGHEKDLPPFIAKSRKMQEVVAIINGIRESDCNVLLTGESGVGKGLVARLIHATGGRSDKPFLALNCAVFTEELLASELFGHQRGAFTGAVSDKQGLLEVADGGTLFLDEIAEMPPALQAKLLNVIEDRQFLRVGGTRPIHVDVRFIAATNQNLSEAIQKKSFRSDLFYRLNVMEIHIPPLRERRADILPLAYHFLEKHARRSNKRVRGFSDKAVELLRSYSYPGNVRELENIVERALILEKGEVILPDSLPISMQLFQIETTSPERLKTIDELSKEYALKVLELVDGNKTRAAEVLGISRTSLWRILKE